LEGFFGSHQGTKARRKEDLSIFAPLLETTDPDERTILARRLVAERCLYGVDKNPLAVEMAKLSLWLITMDKGRAFSFLDHALKCGDSLVGIHSLDQLRTWNLAGTGERAFGTLEIDLIIEKMIAARRQIEQMPVVDIEDQQVKGYLLADAEAITHDLKAAADMLIASYYNTLRKTEQATLRSALLLAARDGADVEEKWRAHADPSAGSGQRLQPFHWPLEFPEVFLGEGRAGFDGFVGNPPFIGGLRIRGALGEEYLHYLKTRWTHAPGVGDYCAYFFLRAFEMLRSCGTTGLIATNTIAQGDTRELGLDHIYASSGVVYRAENNFPWPGRAAVFVSIVHLYKGSYVGTYVLDGCTVDQISSFLGDTKTVANPYRLVANKSTSFIGSYILGTGFTMTPEEAEAMIARDPRNACVLFPYLNGEDLNSHPEQQPSRWVINFFDWPLERSGEGSWALADEKKRTLYLRTGRVPKDYPEPVAADYPECLAIVREKVRPQRMAQNREVRKRYWWRYGEVAPALYEAIIPLQRVLVVAQTSKTLAFSFVPKGWVYAMMTINFVFEHGWAFCLLQSSLHNIWAWQYASTMKQDLRYTPSDIFETFAFPDSVDVRQWPLDSVGDNYHEFRRQLMLTRQEGLTATYNRFHDPGERAADIARLRELHVEMDNAVAAAYGWADLDLGHGFHETAQGIRYTIHEAARRQVLSRLLELNHARYAEEVAAGLHEKKKGKKARQGDVDEGQMGLL